MYRIAVVILVLVTVVGCEQKSEIENSLTTPPTSSPQVPEQALAPQSSDTTSATSQAQIPQTPPSEDYFASQSTVPSTGEAFAAPGIEEIQQALKNAGLYAGKIDGDLGPKTKKAIMEFQGQNDLKADGKVGPRTWGKLKPYLSSSSESTAVGQ